MMDSNYKWGMLMIAYEMAQERFGKEFEDLSEAQQTEIFREAEQAYHDRRNHAADLRRDQDEVTS